MFLLDCHFASRRMILQVSNIFDNCTPLATCNQLTAHGIVQLLYTLSNASTFHNTLDLTCQSPTAQKIVFHHVSSHVCTSCIYMHILTPLLIPQSSNLLQWVQAYWVGLIVHCIVGQRRWAKLKVWFLKRRTTRDVLHMGLFLSEKSGQSRTHPLSQDNMCASWS